ncbi:MAG: hypothetical protein WCO60_06760 [Verrucomicrobiota bacterium]
MIPTRIVALSLAFSLTPYLHAADYLTFEGKEGPGKGKHVVLLAGDEEYRSEEAMPMLGKILSQRHGFKCTVLFSADDDGTIRPGKGDSLTHSESLDSADAIVMSIRFRHWSPETVEKFKGAVNRGIPIVGLRTSTHAFNDKALGNFGKDVLGEKWVSHWGKHKFQATRGVIEKSAEIESIMHGVTDVFGTSDVYEAYPPADAKILMRGQVLKGMLPTDEADDSKKKRATDKEEQGINDPMMAIAWTREVDNTAGKKNRILCTTMGAASDLPNEGLRRLVVNGVYWGLGLDVPQKADVTFVDPYEPTMYGFNGSIPGLKVDDLGLGKTPPKAPAPAAPAAK